MDIEPSTCGSPVPCAVLWAYLQFLATTLRLRGSAVMWFVASWSELLWMNVILTWESQAVCLIPIVVTSVRWRWHAVMTVSVVSDWSTVVGCRDLATIVLLHLLENQRRLCCQMSESWSQCLEPPARYLQINQIMQISPRKQVNGASARHKRPDANCH